MGLQQSQASFPYDVGEAISFPTSSKWELHKGVRKADGAPVSIFLFDVTKNEPHSEIARNAMKRIKTLRFPSLLGYLDGVEMETTFYIVTEEVVPLQEVLRDLKKHPNAISLGLYQILQALAFMNGDCKLLHGNVSVDSIFVNKAGDWKLGSFDLVCSLAEAEPTYKKYHGLVPQKYKPPEVNQGRWPKIQRSPPHTIDVWMVGNVIYEMYNGPFEQQNEIVSAPKAIPKVLAADYKRIFSNSPDHRPEPSELLTSKYFANSLVQSCAFLENIALKEPHEKEEFFKKLPLEMDGFPKAVCTYKMLPGLVRALDYGYANSRALGPLLKIGALLSSEEYATLITPSVVKWFASNDREMRMNLLSGLESFVEHLSPTLINQSIFPNITTGFTDISPKLRELTIRSVVLLAPKLNSRILNGEVLRYFAKLQMDKEDYIRTNTTICLGRVARYLDEATRDKVLVPAFSRALRDPFGPARLAGIMAFGATQEFYGADDVAKKVVPALSYLSVDPDKQVRVAALQKLKMFVEKLEKASLQMPDIQPTGQGNQQQQQQQQQSNEVASGGFLGWAFGSISKTIYGEGQEGQPQTPSAVPSPQQGHSHQTPLQHPQPIAPAPYAALHHSSPSKDSDEDEENSHVSTTPQKGGKKPKKNKPVIVRLATNTASTTKDSWNKWDDDWDEGSSSAKKTTTTTPSAITTKATNNRWDVEEDISPRPDHHSEEEKGGGWSDNDTWGDDDDDDEKHESSNNKKENKGGDDWGGAWGSDDDNDDGDKKELEAKKSIQHSSALEKPRAASLPSAVPSSKSSAATVAASPSSGMAAASPKRTSFSSEAAVDTSPAKVDKAPSKGMGLGSLSAKKPGMTLKSATPTTTTTATTAAVSRSSPVQSRKVKNDWDGWGEEEDVKPTPSKSSSTFSSSLLAADEEEDGGGWGDAGDDDGWGDDKKDKTGLGDDDGDNWNASISTTTKATPTKAAVGSGGGWGAVDDDVDDWNASPKPTKKNNNNKASKGGWDDGDGWGDWND